MPEDSQTSLRLCPTKIDGEDTLFAHKVTQGQCQDRQRGHYHKCFTCVFNNAYVDKQGSPRAVIREPARAQVG